MKFAYYLVFVLWYLFSLLPLRVLYFFSDLLFIPLYYAAAAGVTYTSCKKTARKADGSNDSDGSDDSNV